MRTSATFAAIAAFATLLLLTAGCGQRKGAVETPEEPSSDATAYYNAIDRYLTEEIGRYYPKGDACIPFNDYLAIDESDAEDVVVLGDFWVLNYEQSGDTLKCIAGGNHPGKMHLTKNEDGVYEVTSFDAVADGANNEESAKLIFADKYPEYQAAHSDDTGREKIRAASVAEYVKANGLNVKMYQDYGWPVVMLPE